MVKGFLLLRGILDTILSRKIHWCFYFCLWRWNIRWYLKFTYSCFRKSIIISIKKFYWYVKRAKYLKEGGLSAPNDPPPPVPTHSTTMRTQMFSKIGVLKNFAVLREKHPCSKRVRHRCLSVNIAKFLRTVFSVNTSGGCLWTH